MRRTTLEEEMNICAHYPRNISLRELACLFSTSHETIRKILKRHGVPIRAVGVCLHPYNRKNKRVYVRKGSKHPVQEWIKLNETFSCNEIAKMFGVTKGAVIGAIHREKKHMKN